MSTKIVQMQDENENNEFPVTSTKAVYDDENNRLDNTLTAINDSLNGKLDVAKIDKGTISLPSVSKGNYGTIDVNFNHSFSSSPKVMLTLYTSQGNIYRVYLQVSVSTITQNGFTVAYAYDGSATLGTTSVNWVAIG